MKHHIMISFGLIMAAIFGFRLAEAITVPGLSWLELYLLGGNVIAAWLIFAGLKERRHARAQAEKRDSES